MNSSLSGACCGVAFLSGHHQAPLFLLLFTGGLWGHAFFAKGANRKIVAGLAAAFGVFAFVFSALQVLPAVEYGRVALRWVGAREPVGWLDRIPTWFTSISR